MKSSDRVAPAADQVSPTTTALLSEFSVQLERTVDWLNSMPLSRLDRSSDGGSVLDRAHGLAQAVVAAHDQLVGEPVRELPRLRAHGAGSQLAVVGHELAETIEVQSIDSLKVDLALVGLVSSLLELRRTVE